MVNVTLRDGERHLSRLLSHTPVTAARNGALNMLYDALASASPPVPMIDELTAAAVPLCEALKVPDLDAVPAALCALEGRPPRAVVRALRSPQMVDAMCTSLDMLGLIELSGRVAQWGPVDPSNPSMSALALSGSDREQRGQLVGQLRARTAELIAEWERVGVVMRPGTPMDGRSLVAAARAWQVPMVNGEVPPRTRASAALHPNRLGRTAAVVAYSSMRKALSSDCSAPDRWVFEAIALLVAVGEAISRPPEEEGYAWGDTSGLQVQVRVGQRMGEESFDPDAWWPKFDAWGTHTSRIARSIPTAWKLGSVEADVLVWALCSVAVRLAVAASAPVVVGQGRRLSTESDPWPAHRDAELPRWTEGARSVWALMQSGRPFELWTAFPELVVPALDVDHSWPWS
jgi:hypothetical protein